MFRLALFFAATIALAQAYIPLSREEKLQIRAEAEHFTPEDVQNLIDHHNQRTDGANSTKISPDDKESLIKEYELLLLEAKAVDLSMDDLKTAVNSAIKFAAEKLTSFATQVAATIKAILSASSKAIDGDNEDLTKELKSIKDRATAMVINVKDCLKQKEDQLKAIPKTYGKKLADCGAKKLDEAKALIKKITDSVKDFVKQVNTISSEWSACGGGVSGALCKVKVGYQIAKAAVTIPVSVIKAASEAIPMVQFIHVDLGKCAAQIAEDFLKEGQGLIAFMEDCLVKKIKLSTVPPKIY